MSKSKEYVLCVPRAGLPDHWFSHEKRAIAMDEKRFVRTCAGVGFQWVERSVAESNPKLKQIIPYIVIIHEENRSFIASGDEPSTRETIAVYRRKGSEKRLHDLYSIGIGGHINPMDDDLSIHRNNGAQDEMPIENHAEDRYKKAASDFQRILHTGMNRELDEELIERPVEDEPAFCGIINEEQTEVGSVHLGALFLISTRTPEKYVPGPELTGFHWVNRDALDDFTLELWSDMALTLLKGRKI